MNYAFQLTEVRAHFGLTQRELADWLNLSRSHFALVEAGMGPLPLHARLWLRPWSAALSQPDAATLSELPPDPPPFVPPTGPAPVVARLTDCYLTAERFRAQLIERQVRVGYQQRRLAAGPLLAAALPPVPVDPAMEPMDISRRRRWLARLLEAATDALHPEHPTTGATAKALLAARYTACWAEGDWLTAYLLGL